MGPSLLLWNNSSFSHHDFESIKKTYSMGKAENASATGQFGQGFNCSFSISDDPSLVSSGEAWWFDVHKTGIGRETGKTIGRWKNLNDQQIKKWLETFELPNCDTKLGTIFRLPLRSEESSVSSAISNDIFSFNDFDKWVKEWCVNAQSLLFIRNVRNLTLQEITTDGELITHLSIETINESEINDVNQAIQADFKNKKPKEICETWLREQTALTQHFYRHQFLTSYIDPSSGKWVEQVEIWAVVNGLFNGKDNSLIKQALKILNSGAQAQKILPWAGVATLINADNPELKSASRKLYTFLPLRKTSDYPVHIHGWFDVDTKREDIERTHKEGSAHESLLEWNRLLMQDAIGVAWAGLVEHLKQDISTAEYIDLWPVKNSSDSFSAAILTGFYEAIANKESIYCQYQGLKRWTKPKSDIYYLSNSESTLLFEALSSGFMMLLCPLANTHRKYLKDAGAALSKFTPNTARSFIADNSHDIRYPLTFEKISISIISTKEYYMEVANYCADEGTDFAKLSKLPFSLSKDDVIHDSEHALLIDVNSQQKQLLNGLERLELNTDLAELAPAGTNLPDNWYRATFDNFLSVIKTHFDIFREIDNWHEGLVDYVSSASAAEIRSAKNVLRTIDMIHLEDGTWCAPFKSISHFGPVLVSDNEQSYYKYLRQLNVNLVQKDKTELYRKLNNHDHLLVELSPAFLIEHILINYKSNFWEDEKLHRFVIKYISSDISWVDSLSQSQLSELRSIPFVETESGQKLSLDSNTDFYLDSGFTTPENIGHLNGSYELVADPSSSFRSLLKKLGVKEQTAFNYVSDITIPFFERSSDTSKKVDVLAWLVSEWSHVKLSCDEQQLEDLIQSIGSVAVIPNKDLMEWSLPNCFYTSVFYNSLPSVLQNNEMEPYILEKNRADWDIFLKDIGCSTILLSSHVNRTVGSIIRLQDRDRAVDLWNYIIINLPTFLSLKFGARPLFDHLIEQPCLPVANTRELLQPDGEVPSLSKASNLILSNDLPILGGIYYSLDRRVKLEALKDNENFTRDKIISLFRLIKKPAWNDIYQNFRRLRQLESDNNKLRETKIVDYAKSFYKFLGRTDPIAIPQDIVQACIRLGSMWIPSKDVFQISVKVSGIYNWDALFRDKEDNQIKQGLVRLGVHPKPLTSYMAGLISDTARYPINTKLNEANLTEIGQILDHLLSESHDNLKSCPSFPLLSELDLLVKPEHLFINDLPAYDNSQNRNTKLEFVKDKYRFLANILNVKYVASELYEIIDEDESVEATSEEYQSCIEIEQYVHDPSFLSGLIRIIADEQALDEKGVELIDKEKLIPRYFKYFSKLSVNYFNEDIWIYTNDDASNLIDHDESILNIKAQDSFEDMIDEISLFISKSAKLSTESYSYVSRILRSNMGAKDIDEFLDKKNLKALPRSFEVVQQSELFNTSESCTINNDVEDDSYDDVFDTDTDLEQEDFGQDYSISYPSDSKENLVAVNEDTKKAPLRQSRLRPILSLKNRYVGVTERKSTSIANSGFEVPPPTEVKSASDNTGRAWDQENNATLGGGNSNFAEGRNTASSDSSIKGSNSRYPVYVAKAQEDNTSDKNSNMATEIGNKGESFVIDCANDLILSPENELVKAQTNQKGYDVTEINPSGEIVRYIEVKTLVGQWGLGGVSISESQHNFARINEDWWLFVVECIDGERPEIHQFSNPFKIVNEYRFDHSWKQLAIAGPKEIILTDVNDSVVQLPQVGDVFILPNRDSLIEILEVQPRGELTMVTAKDLETEKVENIKCQLPWPVVLPH